MTTTETQTEPAPLEAQPEMLPVPVKALADDLQRMAVTPAQARIEAVADMLHDAYAKASTLALSPDEIAKLTADFPDEAVLRGAGGDPNLLYIQHSAIRRRLASVFGPGQWSLINRRTWLDEQAGFMYAECVLVIRGCYVGEAIGAQRYSPRNARLNYSDAVEGAQSEALRRIAGKYLDCGIQVWDRNFCDAWMKRHSKLAASKPSQAAAQQTPQTTPPPAESDNDGGLGPAPVVYQGLKTATSKGEPLTHLEVKVAEIRPPPAGKKAHMLKSAIGDWFFSTASFEPAQAGDILRIAYHQKEHNGKIYRWIHDWMPAGNDTVQA